MKGKDNMLVKNKIKGQVYEKLMEYANKKCDAVMFVANKSGFNENECTLLDENMKRIKQQFADLFLKSRNGRNWIFSAKMNIHGNPNFDDLFEILFYKFDEKLKEYMLTNKDLYDWFNPDRPEDISIFKNGYCWLYSITHEEMCDIYCEDEKEYEYLKSIGIEFWESKFTPIPQNELYYEDYGLNNTDNSENAN